MSKKTVPGMVTYEGLLEFMGWKRGDVDLEKSPNFAEVKLFDIPACQIDEEGYIIDCYSRVLTLEGKYNIMDLFTGDFMSPFDFDDATPINSNTGELTITLKGKTYKACPQGFFPDEKSYKKGEGLTFDELEYM